VELSTGQPLLQAFPTPALSASLFIYNSRGGCPAPTLSWSMPHFSRCYKLSLIQGYWAGAATSLAVLFIYSSCEGVPLPHSHELRVPHPLSYVSFFLFQLFFIFQFVFFSFFPGWGSICPGAMLICPSAVCGSTVCH
jgi:hypothetical protein